MKKILLSILFALTMMLAVFGCSSSDSSNDVSSDSDDQLSTVAQSTDESSDDSYNDSLEATDTSDASSADSGETLDIDGAYTSKEDVALYIHTYNQLPNNFITKKTAEKLGWSGGSLEPYAPGKSIGGDRFGNYEGKLPKKAGRTYTECDIDTMYADKRGAKRIIFSNDGLIYYTDDHYETFTLLYGDDPE